MLVTKEIVDEFEKKIRAAHAGVRLGSKSCLAFWQTESSMRPLLLRLTGFHTSQRDLDWDHENVPFTNLIRALPLAKQERYADAIKYLIKKLSVQESKIFRELKTLGAKVSKAQQRYTIPVVPGDAGPGLCVPMTLLWLKDQLSGPNVAYPRLETTNVIASAAARTQIAAALESKRWGGNVTAAGLRHGLALRDPIFRNPRWHTSFADVHAAFAADRAVNAVLLTFIASGTYSHSIAIVRENSASFQFYDCNVGSYRITPDNLQAFLHAYNTDCLPRKWTGYHEPDSKPFSEIYKVAVA